jgi:TIGR03009 family protein
MARLVRFGTLAFVAALLVIGDTARSQQKDQRENPRPQGTAGTRPNNNGPSNGGPNGNGGPAQGTLQVGSNAGKQGNAAPLRQVKGPFELTQEEFENLFAVLKAWERDTADIKTMKSNLRVYKYDPTFGNKPQELTGELRFEAPDKGLYRVKDAKSEGWSEYWMCDGKSVFEFSPVNKQLIERTLPPELQGKRIVDGPMPFFLGIDANRLLHRYFMRIVPTPAQAPKDQIWIEAWPKYQADAANYHHVTVILVVSNDKKLSPYAVEKFDTNGKDRTVHCLDNIAVNESKGWFQKNEYIPKLPSGWIKVINPEQQAPPPEPRKATTAQPVSKGGNVKR